MESIQWSSFSLLQFYLIKSRFYPPTPRSFAFAAPAIICHTIVVGFRRALRRRAGRTCAARVLRRSAVNAFPPRSDPTGAATGDLCGAVASAAAAVVGAAAGSSSVGGPAGAGLLTLGALNRPGCSSGVRRMNGREGKEKEKENRFKGQASG